MMDLDPIETICQTPVMPALRGVTSTEIRDVADTLLGCGVKALEVPLRTRDPAVSDIEPEALRALAVLSEEYSHKAVIIAGGVTKAADIDQLGAIGVRVCLSLGLQADVVEASVSKGLLFFPGVETVSEAMNATQLGAAGLKLFPAMIPEPDGSVSSRISPGYVAYLRRFVSVPLIASGNAFDQQLTQAYLAAGADCVNVGPQLFTPGIDSQVLRQKYEKLVGRLS